MSSLYRYYPNKDAIIVAITELYVEDIGRIFQDIAQHPFLRHLSWDEVLLLMIDAWVNYSRLNGPFAFLYAEKANPRLFRLNRKSWRRFISSFNIVLKKRCPEISERDMILCFQLSLAAVELGINEREYRMAGRHLHHDAVSAIAAHMLRTCTYHQHKHP